MNQILKKSLAKTSALPEQDQERLAKIIDDFVEQTISTAELERNMQDPEYRRYVENALARSEADIAAGGVTPATTAFHDLKAKFFAKYGV